MWSLFALVLSLSPAHINAKDAPSFLGDVVDVASTEEEVLFDGEFGRFRTAQLLLIWGSFESAGRADAVGDNGKSCGCLQTGTLARKTFSCQDLNNNRQLGLRVGLRYMVELKKKFGNVEKALRAYAGGLHHNEPKVVQLVKTRCALMNGCT